LPRRRGGTKAAGSAEMRRLSRSGITWSLGNGAPPPGAASRASAHSGPGGGSARSWGCRRAIAAAARVAARPARGARGGRGVTRSARCAVQLGYGAPRHRSAPAQPADGPARPGVRPSPAACGAPTRTAAGAPAPRHLGSPSRLQSPPPGPLRGQTGREATREGWGRRAGAIGGRSVRRTVLLRAWWARLHGYLVGPLR
jgi:hypothetical protein